MNFKKILIEKIFHKLGLIFWKHNNLLNNQFFVSGKYFQIDLDLFCYLIIFLFN